MADDCVLRDKNGHVIFVSITTKHGCCIVGDSREPEFIMGSDGKVYKSMPPPLFKL